jgi:hypothetical protein
MHRCAPTATLMTNCMLQLITTAFTALTIHLYVCQLRKEVSYEACMLRSILRSTLLTALCVPVEQDAASADLLATLFPALETYDCAAAAQLWPPLATACTTCLSCALAYHSLQTMLEDRNSSLADELLVHRAVHLERTLQQACAKLSSSARAAGAAELGNGVVHALLEALLFQRLLRDHGVHRHRRLVHCADALQSAVRNVPCQAATVAAASANGTAITLRWWRLETTDLRCTGVMDSVVVLLQTMSSKSVPLDITESGPLPGMIVLAAHNDDSVRRLAAQSMLAKLSTLPADVFDEGHDQWGQLVDAWVCNLYLCHSLTELHVFASPASCSCHAATPYVSTLCTCRPAVCSMQASATMRGACRAGRHTHRRRAHSGQGCCRFLGCWSPKPSWLPCQGSRSCGLCCYSAQRQRCMPPATLMQTRRHALSWPQHAPYRCAAIVVLMCDVQ